MPGWWCSLPGPTSRQGSSTGLVTGTKQDLRAIGVTVRQHLPGVGQNLLDHPFAIDVATAVMAPHAEHGKQLQGQAMARSRSASSPDEIDCHLYNGQSFDSDLGRWVMGFSVSMVNALSTGTVTSTSADPNELPRVEHRHYSDPGDLERICDGIELITEISRSPQLSPLLEPRSGGSWDWSDRETLQTLVRERSVTTNHCSGTAKMGPANDPLAVVDASGRVYGAEGLVVADSSIFPTCPRGNIHFPVVAVAERIADVL